MTRLDIRLELPDTLAQEARQAGLLAPEKLESLLREALRKQACDRLFAAMDRMAAVEEPPPMTAAEVQAEIEAARRERRAER